MITLFNTNTPHAGNGYAKSKFKSCKCYVLVMLMLFLFCPRALSQGSNGTKYQAVGKQNNVSLTFAFEAEKFHAVIIACSNYTGNKWPRLENATADGDSLKKELITEYGFASNNVVTLYNMNKRQILEGLYKKLDTLGENDNVLIFYSGHGTFDTSSYVAYWVPVNAEGRYDYISNSDITVALSNTKAKHVLIMADACYSGIMRGPAFDDDYNDSLTMRAKSRQILTSGATAAVPGVSTFVPTIVQELKLNSSHYMLASQLYINIAKTVLLQSGRAPIFKPLEGLRNSISYGMFYFRKNLELSDAAGAK